MKKKSTDGSVLILVLFVAVTSGLVLTSLTRLAMTEREFNDDSRLIIEAKEAAEATVECGFAQLVNRFEKRTSFPSNALSPATGNPLILTPEFYQLFQNGSGRMESMVRMPPYPYNPQANWGSLDTEIIGGQVPPGEWKFIDGRIPGNEFDPLRDKLVFVREVELYGKATVQNLSTGYWYEAYVTQNLQVRDAPLFAHAIFYNMDMEIAPGPAMDVKGSVHANGDMFIQANSSLDFFKNVSATGQLFHGPNPIISKSRDYGKVTFADGAGNQVDMKSGSQWIDSNLDDFRSLASNRWNGNVQAYEHGIQKHNPVAIKSYERDNPDTHTNDDPLNYAYQLIQPLTNKKESVYDPELERQKFSHKAGLVIHIEVPKMEEVISDLGGGADYNDIEVQKEFLDIGKGAGNPVNNPLTVYQYQYVDGTDEIVYRRSGRARISPIKKVDAEDHFIRVKPYAASGDTVESGLYDKRMQEGINIVEVDVEKLAIAVEANNTNYWGDSDSLPENWWNGVVYVEVSTKDGQPARPDGVVVAEDGWAVKLVNGEKIPNPDFGWTKDLYGTTFATNAPMYIHGNYNADGNSSTGSANNPDIKDVRKEPPAALIADAVTILSNSWDDKDSLKSRGSRRTTSFTEVAAAILTGLVPSDKNGWNNYSGGVENFPRFLEDWDTTLRYRGSMVALFESEVATEPWGKNDVYDPPKRDWGFNSLYAEGYYPPGTPNSRTFRRINYRNLTEPEYAAALTDLAGRLNP
jgi:hypothetical protein